MLGTEPARDEEPFFAQADTADEFEAALRQAVRLNAGSMEDLRGAIRNCVVALRAEGMHCEAALLTMKACVKHIGRKHRSEGGVGPLPSDLLMEQIVRWSISEFYHSV